MFRRFLGVFGNLPGLFIIIFGPLVGIMQGHLKHPDVLISDLMSVPAYKEIFGCVAITNSAVNIYLWIEVLRYTRGRAPANVHKSIDVMITLLVFLIFPGNLLVVFFPFEEIGLFWFLHCLGAAMVFGSMAGIGFVYLFYVSPTLTEHNLVPKEDAWYRKMACIMVCVLCVAGMAVRPFHIANPANWSWTLLVIEVLFSLIGILASVVANWRTLGELDKVEPVAFGEVLDKKD